MAEDTTETQPTGNGKGAVGLTLTRCLGFIGSFLFSTFFATHYIAKVAGSTALGWVSFAALCAAAVTFVLAAVSAIRDYRAPR